MINDKCPPLAKFSLVGELEGVKCRKHESRRHEKHEILIVRHCERSEAIQKIKNE
jgi:hypothetical protein